MVAFNDCCCFFLIPDTSKGQLQDCSEGSQVAAFCPTKTDLKMWRYYCPVECATWRPKMTACYDEADASARIAVIASFYRVRLRQLARRHSLSDYVYFPSKC
jgi:hypothetical protein